MKFFADDILKPFISANRYVTICEIGASYGENTDKILELPEVRFTLIDPCLDMDLTAKYQRQARVTVRKGTSLGELPLLEGAFDCFLIDGDHNWYTVYNEIGTIHTRELLRKGGTAFFHDVGWPYGRRDMYFRPEVLPPEHVLPSEKKGVIPGVSALAESGGFNPQFLTASHEGGPRNGVLTAVEDFVRKHADEYAFFWYNEENGLGVLFRKNGLSRERLSFEWLRLKLKTLQALKKIKRSMPRAR